MRLSLVAALPAAALLLSACAPVTAQSTTSSSTAGGPADQHLEIARRVLREAPLVDGHNDLPWAIRDNKAAPMDVEAYDLRRRTPGHTDLARLKAGMVGGQFWSVYVPSDVGNLGFARVQLEQIDIARRVIEKYPELEWALTARAVREAAAQGKVGSLLGLEGGHAIENSLGALRAYYDLGARYMTLTHSATIDWADAATGLPTHGGLTEFGREVVREMNRLGMLVDLSHVSPGTMSDALDVSEAPVIFSHSSARAITDHPRNVPDSILRRMPANGGVVMITFVPSFVSKAVSDYSDRARNEATRLQQRFGTDTAGARAAMDAWRRANPEPRATMADVIAHIEHVRQVAGVDHVGIGGDFDGIDTVIEGLEDVSTYPALFAELSRRGWSEADLRKLAGENILRVMERAEAVSARLRQSRAPSTKTIEELDGKR
ncbi:MAG TPA: dipeptidase [Gemmatimonadaceae bacterium]|nr:dipeptidase [Gemmatimonadaceae bacterium]